MATNQFVKGNAIGSKNIDLSRLQSPSIGAVFRNNPNFKGYSDPQLRAGGKSGFSPWMIGAGALGLGALGLGAYGLSHLGGDGVDVVPPVLPQQNDMNGITSNPYAMGALGAGAAGLGYGLMRRR